METEMRMLRTNLKKMLEIKITLTKVIYYIGTLILFITVPVI